MSEVTLNSLTDYTETFEAIKLKINGLSDAQLKWKPAPETWSVQEIIAHLVDSSLVHSIRIRKIVAENNKPYLLYDQDAWVSYSKANEAVFSDILAAFEAILVYNALFYGRLSDVDWEKRTSHDGKELAVSDLFQGFIRHVQIHLNQIERNIARFTPASLEGAFKETKQPS